MQLKKGNTMAIKPIPDGYHSISPYIMVKNGKKALEFYKKAFGAQVVSVCESEGKIMHAELKIGDSMFMLSDEFPSQEESKDGCNVFSPQTLKGTCAILHLYVKDVDASFKQAIQSGAKVVRELENAFWGDRYGQIEDPFGHRWSLATHIEDVSKEEVDRRAAEIFGK